MSCGLSKGLSKETSWAASLTRLYELSALLQEAAEGCEPSTRPDHDDGRGELLRQLEAAVADEHWHQRPRRPLLQVVAGNALMHAPCSPVYSR